MHRYWVAPASFVVLLSATVGEGVAADVARGERVFKRCQACHALGPDGSQENGPTLHGVFGRQAGTVETYPAYSEAMKASGIVWTEETLDQFLATPKQMIEGNTMNFSRLRKAQDRAALIAYLLQATR